MSSIFTTSQLEQVYNEGKQAFINGQAIVCPYADKDSLQLRVKWLSGYENERKRGNKK